MYDIGLMSFLISNSTSSLNIVPNKDLFFNNTSANDSWESTRAAPMLDHSKLKQT